MLNRATLRLQSSPPMPYDRWLLLVIALLAGFGLLMVASASIVISDQQMHKPFYFFYRQLIGVILGILMGGIVVQFNTALWEKTGVILLLATLFLLGLVLLPGIGHTVHGSSRWIGYGSFRIQVSEIAKLALVIYMAGYLVRNNKALKTDLAAFLKPMGLLGIIAILLLCEPDFGATVVIVATALGMMFLAGMRLMHFLLMFLVIIILLSVVAISEPYRIVRLTAFLNPWAHPYNGGYQLTQSLIAFGRGGWFGVGLGKSIQKLFYLPEAHTDFLFAVIAEELGLFGVLFLIILFTFLSIRIFWIGKKAQYLGRHFAGYMAYGIGLWIVFQFMVSIGVNSGLLPTKGLTLPLVSYGGSSMLINCIALGLVLRVDYENRMLVLGLREMSELKRVLIIAGGTGGHVFPGLALAHYLRKNNVEVSWIGTKHGLEARLVTEAKFPIHYISISGIRGKRLKEKLSAPIRLMYAIFQALKWVRQLNPDVIIGMGGFVSGPGGIASFVLRKKLIIHEQNAKPGLTNQWLSRIAHKVLEAFPNTFRNRSNVVTVGNPVRSEIALLPLKEQRSRPLHLLVVGGSLGAQAINTLLPHALFAIPENLRPEVLHQAGEKHFHDAALEYKKLNLTVEVVPFIKEMDKAYAWADMVLCRAGALTITELCTAGLGAILIPYPYAVDDHQTANAEVMVKANAALLMKQAQLTTENLAKSLTEICISADKSIKMAKAAYQIRQIDAVEKIFTICKEMCH